MMDVNQYVTKLSERYKSGLTTEHSYRGDLLNLLESLFPNLTITNEPKRISCGAPDYILTKGDVPVGYLEAKDLGADLFSKSYDEQFQRYRSSLNNLIITNYIDFHYYQDGELKATYKIAELRDSKVVPIASQFEPFKLLLQQFSSNHTQTITSPLKLALLMANKAKMLALVIEAALNSDDENEANTSLQDQLYAFKDVLIHDITAKQFADIYSQTIAYGMFAGRLHDTSLDTFTRREAADLIPKSNPFLRKLFQYIAGYDLDQRIIWIVDALAEIFRATDVTALLKGFGSSTQQNDPIIHFYETFLSEYDPELRASRGVWYTPEPVVKFIVQSVDHLLQTEFGLSGGLADTTKTLIESDIIVKATADQRSKIKSKKVGKSVHKVQILDPATGTGTFLAEVVRYIYSEKLRGQYGIWSSYIENDLIPRLHGFELLMASYAMAHLKLDLLLEETGYKPTKDQRLRVYLTNSLEEHHPDTGTLFANWLSTEANEANYIKRDVPVMVVIGNPPYAVSSSNKGEWIQNLVRTYKYELNERKTNLDDDYVKFIRYGQHFIDKNGEGILAFITNNSFIDGTTHRVMRQSLLNSFDKIYIIDLHGNSTKQEKSPDGSKDENVFDIKQGVSINLFIKNRSKSKSALAEVFHTDLFGLRKTKYQFLLSQTVASIQWTKIEIKQPHYFFVPKNYDIEQSYNEGFSVTELFKIYGSGIKTERDYLTVRFTREEMQAVVNDFQNMSAEDLKAKYSIQKDSRDWKIQAAKDDIIQHQGQDLYRKVYYRVFDFRHTYYTGTSRGFIGTPGAKLTNHMSQQNIGLVLKRSRILGDQNLFRHFFITNSITDINFLGDQSYCFPLYLYPTEAGLNFEGVGSGELNLNLDVIARFEEKLNLKFHSVYTAGDGTFGPEHVVYYIYAVLNSLSYRIFYTDFLKIDFPKIPYPQGTEVFWELVRFGERLKAVHLFEVVAIQGTEYPQEGSNLVERYVYANGKVWINSTQYFANVPETAWNYFIGGYQPAQKWLKDRKGKHLSYDEILHYQRMIAAFDETDRLIQQVDEIIKVY